MPLSLPEKRTRDKGKVGSVKMCGGKKEVPFRPRRRVGPERRWRMSVIVKADTDAGGFVTLFSEKKKNISFLAGAR